MSFDPKESATRACIQKMFSGSFFSICDVDNLLKLHGVVPDDKTYKVMHVCHCVHYSTMEPKMRQWLADQLTRMLRQPPLILDTDGQVVYAEAEVVTPKMNFLQKLLK